MKYLILLRENIRRQKGGFLGILILIFIISMSLCAVLAVWRNASVYESEQLERVGYGDITAWVIEQPGLSDAIRQMEALDETEKVTRQDVFMVQYIINGKDAESQGEIVTYDPETYDYHLYKDDLTGFKERQQMPKEGEIYVSPSFCSLYDVEIGDTLEVKLTDGGEVLSYTVAGFFEDPFMGSAMMGIKSMLICAEDMEQLRQRIMDEGEHAIPVEGAMLHIYRNQDTEISLHEFQVLLNDKTDLKSYSFNMYSKSVIENFMLIAQNIFAGFLLVFVAVLLIVAMLVISHSISTGIEQDYTNMGILKALGFTKGNLQLIKMCQYLLAVFLGMMIGVPAAFPVVLLVNRMVVTTTGLMVPAALPAGLCAVSLCIVFSLLAVVIAIKAAKIGKITPIRAIRGGMEDVYWRSRFTTKISGRGLSFQLAFRQITSGKKQYVSAGIVTALLVFFLSLTARIGAWMGPDGEGLMKSFNVVNYDIGVRAEDEKTREEAEAVIASDAKISHTFQVAMLNATLDHVDYFMYVVSEPEQYKVQEGRTCKYDNEVLVTEIVAEELKKSIGDTVVLDYEGHTEEFLISGIYQCANDMGANFGISKEGAKRLGVVDENIFYTFYKLEDAPEKNELVDTLAERFGDRITVDENTWSGLSSIMLGMQALEVLMYVITILFILVVISMTGSRILYREEHDFGVYKSLGFTSGSLRLMFALRFGIVAVLGSVLGVILSAIFTDPLAGALLKFCGIGSFTSHLTPASMLLPAAQVAVLFVLFAYFAAGKIKRVEPGILITE